MLVMIMNEYHFWAEAHMEVFALENIRNQARRLRLNKLRGFLIMKQIEKEF
jgi:hypothetical protein